MATSDTSGGFFQQMGRQLGSASLYKPTQGRVARQATGIAVGVLIAIGAWRLSLMYAQDEYLMRFGPPLLITLLGAWFAFRLVHIPRFADFLIAVEAEMAKVTWPTKNELIRSVIVVIVVMLILAALLFGYDVFWTLVFKFLGVLY